MLIIFFHLRNDSVSGFSADTVQLNHFKSRILTLLLYFLSCQMFSHKYKTGKTFQCLNKHQSMLSV